MGSIRAPAGAALRQAWAGGAVESRRPPREDGSRPGVSRQRVASARWVPIRLLRCLSLTRGDAGPGAGLRPAAFLAQGTFPVHRRLGSRCPACNVGRRWLQPGRLGEARGPGRGLAFRRGWLRVGAGIVPPPECSVPRRQ